MGARPPLRKVPTGIQMDAEMNGALARAATWFDKLNQLLAVLASVILVALTLAICAEIFTRTALAISNPWLVELSEIALLYLTFLAAAWVLGNDKHVAIDLIFSRLSTRAASNLYCVLAVIGAACCFVVVWAGLVTVLDQYLNDIREPTIMAPRTFWITAAIPFGFTLIGLQFLRRALRALRGLPLSLEGRDEAGGH